MQDLFDKVISNPTYLTLAVILVVILLYAIFKRIMKLLIILLILIIGFMVYVHKTGNSVKDMIERKIK